jgi:hypothetical protein
MNSIQLKQCCNAQLHLNAVKSFAHRHARLKCNKGKVRCFAAYVSADSAASEITLEERRKVIMEETKNFILSDLQSAFSTGVGSCDRFAEISQPIDYCRFALGSTYADSYM